MIRDQTWIFMIIQKISRKNVFKKEIIDLDQLYDG